MLSNTHSVSLIIFCIILARIIHLNLDLGLNALHFAIKTLDFIYPLTSVQEDDSWGLNFYRFLWLHLPKSKASVDAIHDISIDQDVSIRIYRPKARNDDDLPPMIVYYHGGGFVLGSIDSVEHIATRLAQKTNFLVASVEYRLAPENKFPAAPKDCLKATKWIYDRAESIGFDKESFIVAGDSAGGNLAAVIAQQLSGIVKFQLLIYPTIPSLGGFCNAGFENRNAPILSSTLKEWFKHRYYKHYTDMKHPYACPLNGPGLQGLPPALIITAELDVLRDEGEEYGNLLAEAGNRVEVVRYNNTVHGFYGDAFLTHGLRALDESASKLLELFN